MGILTVTERAVIKLLTLKSLDSTHMHAYFTFFCKSVVYQLHVSTNLAMKYVKRKCSVHVYF